MLIIKQIITLQLIVYIYIFHCYQQLVSNNKENANVYPPPPFIFLISLYIFQIIH